MYCAPCNTRFWINACCTLFLTHAGVHWSWLWSATAAAATAAAPVSTPALPAAAKPAAPVSTPTTPSFPAAAKPATTTTALSPLLGYCAHMWPDAGTRICDMLVASFDFVMLYNKEGFAKGPEER